MIKTITPAQLLDSIKVGKQPLAIEIKLQNGQIRRFYWHEEKHYDSQYTSEFGDELRATTLGTCQEIRIDDLNPTKEITPKAFAEMVLLGNCPSKVLIVNDDDEIRMYTYSSHDYWNDHDILSLMDAVEARKIYISEGK